MNIFRLRLAVQCGISTVKYYKRNLKTDIQIDLKGKTFYIAVPANQYFDAADVQEHLENRLRINHFSLDDFNFEEGI